MNISDKDERIYFSALKDINSNQYYLKFKKAPCPEIDNNKQKSDKEPSSLYSETAITTLSSHTAIKNIKKQEIPSSFSGKHSQDTDSMILTQQSTTFSQSNRKSKSHMPVSSPCCISKTRPKMSIEYDFCNVVINQ